MPEEVNSKLDRLGAFLMASIVTLLMWRTLVGGLSSYQSGAATMLLGFPEWTVYAVMVPALGLTAVIALSQAIFGFTEVSE